LKQVKYISEGVHSLCDLHNVSNDKLNDIDYLESIMIKACKLSGATILNIYKHKFEPAGVTILISLSESHASIHTYVDLDSEDSLGKAMLDFFTCGNSCLPKTGIKYLIDNLCSEESVVSMKVFKRGLDSGIIDLSKMCEIMC